MEQIEINDIRQNAFFNKKVFNNTERVAVIGAGATGSKVCSELNKMGIHFDVYDFDNVEEHNIRNQEFPHRMIGKNKAEAVKLFQEFMIPNPGIRAFNKRVDSCMDFEDNYTIIFLLIDNMESRISIVESIVEAYKTGMISNQVRVIETGLATTSFEVYFLNSSRFTRWLKIAKAKKENLDRMEKEREKQTTACNSQVTLSPIVTACAALAASKLLFIGAGLENELYFRQDVQLKPIPGIEYKSIKE